MPIDYGALQRDGKILLQKYQCKNLCCNKFFLLRENREKREQLYLTEGGAVVIKRRPMGERIALVCPYSEKCNPRHIVSKEQVVLEVAAE